MSAAPTASFCIRGATHAARAVVGFFREFEVDERLDDAQIERLLARMTPDAEYRVFAWNEPCAGRDSIRAELQRQATQFSNATYEIRSIASAGNIVFVEMIDHVTMNGTTAGFHVTGVFEVTDDEKIRRWRDYPDSREM